MTDDNADSIMISDEHRTLAKTLNVAPEIHSEDLIFKFVQDKLWNGQRQKAVTNYFQLGLHSAKLAREFVADVARVAERERREWAPRRILDFAAGFGNATRHLTNSFPDSKISSCDIHEKAIRFHENVLKVRCHLSSFDPEKLLLPPQDVIFVMSLFSHLPKHNFTRWIRALGQTLAPGGALIFTAHGIVSACRGGFDVPIDEDGFGFRPKSEQHDLPSSEYGLTVSYPRFVTASISECRELRLSALREAYWWSNQDTYVCIRQT